MERSLNTLDCRHSNGLGARGVEASRRGDPYGQNGCDQSPQPGVLLSLQLTDLTASRNSIATQSKAITKRALPINETAGMT